MPGAFEEANHLRSRLISQQADIRQLHQEISELNDQISKLKTQLGRYRREARQLRSELSNQRLEISTLDATRRQVKQEAVRSRAVVRSSDTKAEAVLILAEAKMKLAGLDGEELDESQLQVLDQAKMNIGLGESALDRGDYSEVAKQVTEANGLLEGLAASLDGGPESRLGGPLTTPMEVLQTCNVRAEAYGQSEVLFYLPAGTRVWAREQSRGWIWIETEDRQSGWVYHRLLREIE